MRLRTFASFGFGFAAGVVSLALALWWSGRLTAPRTQDTSLLRIAEPESATGILRNAPPAVSTPAPPPVELEKSALEKSTSEKSGRLAMPVGGVDPSKLHSSFAEVRDGHRHEALDIMAPRGTPVTAVAQGNVAKLFTSKQGGLTVYQFDDSQTLCYYYAHLDRYAPGLQEGTLLRKGDVLGYVGSTGDASPNAPHLHFAIFKLGPEKQWWKGTAVDPLPYFK
jgi:murein DD-endopeptidase MepM/ murein hydrolase activator NlpD